MQMQIDGELIYLPMLKNSEKMAAICKKSLIF